MLPNGQLDIVSKLFRERHLMLSGQVQPAGKLMEQSIDWLAWRQRFKHYRSAGKNMIHKRSVIPSVSVEIRGKS